MQQKDRQFLKNDPISEKELHLSIKNASLPIAIVEQNGKIDTLNKAFADLFKVEKLKNIFDDFFLKQDGDRIQSILDKMEEKNEKKNIIQKLRLLIKKEKCAMKLQNNGLDIISLTMKIEKPTDAMRKNIGAKHFIIYFYKLGNVAVEDIIKEENKAKNNDFSSILVHEIRTPLNAIINITQYLLEITKEKNTENNEELVEGLEIAVQNSHRLNIFLEDLSEFIILESGEKKMEEAFQIKDILPKCQQLFTLLSHEKNIDIEISFEEIKEKIILGDMRRLYQTLMILILFMTKTFMNGKIKMIFTKIFSEEIQEEALQCKTKILLEKNPIKNDFYVNLLRQNIEIMEGKESIIYGEKTAEIDLHIPFIIEDIKKKNAPTKKAVKNQQKKTAQGCILIIDDEPVGSKMLDILLKKENIIIHKAADGQESIQQIKKYGKEINLILMDLMLPDTTGYELFHEIKKYEPSLPIIVFSALNEKEEIKKMIEFGFFDYVPKPFSEQDLKNIIEFLK